MQPDDVRHLGVYCCACQNITTEVQSCTICREVKLFCPSCYGNHMRAWHGQQILTGAPGSGHDGDPVT
jgi:hypothetical protein